MADEARPPVAIRTMRPYATEEEFLAEERDTFSRSAVTLIGAPTRPRGVVIRFEVTLSNGTPLLRGEGRVLSFQPADGDGPSALTLRFTRLDARSKALVDHAAELREARSGSSPSIKPPAVPALPDSAPTLSTLGPPGESSPVLGGVPPAADSAGTLATTGTFAASPDSASALATTGTYSPSPTAPPAREVLLERLRSRAKTLSPTQVATILTPRRGGLVPGR